MICIVAYRYVGLVDTAISVLFMHVVFIPFLNFIYCVRLSLLGCWLTLYGNIIFQVQVRCFLQGNSMDGLSESKSFLFMLYVCMFAICKAKGLRCNERDSICVTK